MIRVLAIALAAVVTAAPVATAPPACASPYSNCTEAKENDDCDIPDSSDKYDDNLDRDGDGIACEC